jgi:shikimate 5-dehydrogenase
MTAPASATGFDAVVNTTSVGMKPDDQLPLDPDQLTPAMSVSEIIMSPEVTLHCKPPKLEAAALAWEKACWNTR